MGVKRGISLGGRNLARRYSRIGCWRRYLDTRGAR